MWFSDPRSPLKPMNQSQTTENTMSRNTLSEGVRGDKAVWFQEAALGFDFSLCGVVCSLMSCLPHL